MALEAGGLLAGGAVLLFCIVVGFAAAQLPREGWGAVGILFVFAVIMAVFDRDHAGAHVAAGVLLMAPFWGPPFAFGVLVGLWRKRCKAKV